MAVVFPDLAKKKALDIILAASRVPKIFLWKDSGLTPTVATVLADCTTANFQDYADVDISGMAAAIINGAGQGEKSVTAVTFTMGVPGTTNVIYGWGLKVKDDAGTYYLEKIEKFPAPISMLLAGNKIELDLLFLDQLGT